MKWTAQTSGTIADLNDVTFVDQRNGWIVGDAELILHTTDGGNVWQRQYSAQSSGGESWLGLLAVSFPTSQFGCAVGYNGLIMTTTNRGQYWAKTFIPLKDPNGNSYNLFDVRFVDPSHGWVCGPYGFIGVTADGGATWSKSNNPLSNQVATIYFVDAAHGWAGGADGKIITTTNGGLSWTSQTSGTIQAICGITFADRENGWAVDLDGNVLATSDGGASWRIVRKPPPNETQALFAVDTVGAQHCRAVGSPGLIVSSDNAGASWATEQIGTTWLNGVHFVDENHGWAVGNGGTILSAQSSSVLAPGRWQYDVAIDPMALVLPPSIYVKWVEAHHPHTEKEFDSFLRGLTPIDRRLVGRRATSLLEFSRAVAQSATKAGF
jgi:photosystem II stability/assembly factor-like uncharacterized protein